MSSPARTSLAKIMSEASGSVSHAFCAVSCILGNFMMLCDHYERLSSFGSMVLISQRVGSDTGASVLVENDLASHNCLIRANGFAVVTFAAKEAVAAALQLDGKDTEGSILVVKVHKISLRVDSNYGIIIGSRHLCRD